MHYTTMPRMHLSRFSGGTKVLLSMFLATTLAGLCVSALKYTTRAEFSYEGVNLYFRGDESGQDGTGKPGGAEAGEEEVRELVIHERKTVPFLVDVTHPHLFSVPILLFVLCHLVALTRLREWQKILLYAIAFGSFTLTFAAPWLVLVHPSFAHLLIGSGALFLFSMAVLILIAAYEMWFGKPDGARAGGEDLPCGSQRV